MAKPKKPNQDDQDNDGLPDNDQTQAKMQSDQDLDGDGVPDGETSVQSNPIIINR